MTLGKVRHKRASDVKFLYELLIIKHMKGVINFLMSYYSDFKYY